MSTNFHWHLHINLTEYTPGEVEKTTGLSTVMQRDWRHRGFLAKSDKHARFTMLDLTEALMMKMLADRGVGPTRSHVVAARMAAPVVWQILAFRTEGWGVSPSDLFDAIPKNARALTAEEKHHLTSEALMTPRGIQERRRWGGGSDEPLVLDEFSKAGSMTGRVFDAMGIKNVERFTNIIWWPNDEVAFGNYEDLTTGRDLDHEGKPDPRFDGVALVLSVDAVAANLARRLPRPFVSAALEVFNPLPPSPPFWSDWGRTTVSRGKAAYSALLAELKEKSEPTAPSEEVSE